MTPFAVNFLLLVLAASGLIETLYLIDKRYHAEAPACPIGDKGKCMMVLESEYNSLFGIHNDVLGLMFYIGVAAISLFLLVTPSAPPIVTLALQMMIAGGSVMSVFLVYLQWRVIKAWCFWCLLSAITTWVMGGVVLLIKA